MLSHLLQLDTSSVAFKHHEIFNDNLNAFVIIVKSLSPYSMTARWSQRGRKKWSQPTYARNEEEGLRAINLIKEKRCGKIKGRTCADGSSQHKYVPREEASSPAIALESLMALLMINAHKGRDVGIFDIPATYLGTFCMQSRCSANWANPLYWVGRCLFDILILLYSLPFWKYIKVDMFHFNDIWFMEFPCMLLLVCMLTFLFIFKSAGVAIIFNGIGVLLLHCMSGRDNFGHRRTVSRIIL